MGMEHLIRFGVFELDPAAGQLRKSGVPVPLSGQPLDVLTLLVRRPGEVVTREELKEALWPDETFVDFDNGVNSSDPAHPAGSGRFAQFAALSGNTAEARVSIHCPGRSAWRRCS